MDEYITCLKLQWDDLKVLPILTVEQINVLDNDCIRMYLFCYYNYPEFYNYKKKKLLNRCIFKNKNNLILFSAWCGHLDILKYLILRGLNITYTNRYNQNAYMFAVYGGNIEIIKYLETINFNIYQIDYWSKNAHDKVNYCLRDGMEIYMYFINKSKYDGYLKICSICYECEDSPFITCKNNHIVHLECQKQIDKNRCLMCSAKYLI
jgi:hypothetical protein